MMGKYDKRRQGNKERKIRILTYYGGGKCQCVKCSFLDERALSIDHIKGGGAEYRRSSHHSSSLYLWLIKNNFPDGFQTLCMNCQWIKRQESRECFSRFPRKTIEEGIEKRKESWYGIRSKLSKGYPNFCFTTETFNKFLSKNPEIVFTVKGVREQFGLSQGEYNSLQVMLKRSKLVRRISRGVYRVLPQSVGVFA